MKNEIKEIKIKTIGQLLDFVETEEKAKELIDYITNLQEDNEMYAQLKDEYEDIIDKAIEYINSEKVISCECLNAITKYEKIY